MTEQYPFTDLPSLDENIMQPLKELLGDAFDKLVTDYLTSFPDKLAELKLAAQSDDVKTLLQISHTLKSSSGSFGFIRLYKRLEHLEYQARNNDIANSTGQVSLIDQEFNDILNHLDNS